MQYYYSKNNEDLKSKYITSVKRDTDSGNFVLTFADGEVYDNVPMTEDNTAKIEERLTKQAQYAVDHRAKLVRSQKAGTIVRFFSTWVAGATAGMAAFHYTEDPAIVGIVAGTLCIGGLVWSIRHKQELDSKVSEVDGFERRILQHDVIDSYLDNSPNAYRYLEGDTPDDKTDRMDFVQSMKKEHRNPFGFIEIENGGITDAEAVALMRGATREQELGFTYVKSNSR